MVDSTSGANIIMQMANKPSIALEDPIKAMQDVEDLRGKQLSNKKSALGLNMEQSNGIARAMLAASMDPNATPESMATEADRLGQLYGIDNRVISSWKSQIQPGMTQAQLQQLGMRATSLALTPAEQFAASQNSVKYQNIGGRLVPITQNSPLNANPNQLSQQGGPDIKLTQPPGYLNAGPETLPTSEGAVTGQPGIRMGTSPGVYSSGAGFNAGQGTYGNGPVAPGGQVSEENDATPYTWKDESGVDQQGTRGQFRAALGAGRAQANSGQAVGGTQNGPGTYGGYRGSQGGPLPGANPINQKAKEASVLENQNFYREQQKIAANNAPAIRQGEDVLDGLPQTNTGQGAEKIYDALGVLNTFARQFGLPEVKPGDTAAFQETKKNLLAQARASGAASSSVAQLDASIGANPSAKMAPVVIRRMEMNIVGDLRIHGALVNSAANNPELQNDFQNVYQKGRNILQPLGAMAHRLNAEDSKRLQAAIEADKTGRLAKLYEQTHKMMVDHGQTGTVPGVTDIIQ